jgi:hypothetical protein
MIPIDSMVFPEPPRRAAIKILGNSISFCSIDRCSRDKKTAFA